MTLRSAVFLCTLPLLLLSGCDSSGGGNGPPDSVTGTWTGSHSVSAEVDTTDVNEDPVRGSGEVIRSYEVVIAESGADLSVEVTISDSGSVEYDRGVSGSFDYSDSFSAEGTYGPPTMVITDVGSAVNLTDARWKFEVENGTATGNLDVEVQERRADPFPDLRPTGREFYPWAEAVEEEGEDTSITLEKQ